MKSLKLGLCFLTVLMLNSWNISAQTDKKGFFNLTRIGYHNITSVERSVFTPSSGETITEESTKGSYTGSLNNITGYFITNSLSLGIGVGLDGVHNPDVNTLPVFLDLRGYLGEDESSLYGYFNVGPNIDPKIKNASFQTGVTVNIGMGYQLEIANQLFQIDFAYNFKNLEAPVNPDNNVKLKNKIEGVSVNIGVIFF